MSTLAEEQSARRQEAEAAEAQRAAMEEALRQARREVRAEEDWMCMDSWGWSVSYGNWSG